MKRILLIVAFACLLTALLPLVLLNLLAIGLACLIDRLLNRLGFKIVSRTICRRKYRSIDDESIYGK